MEVRQNRAEVGGTNDDIGGFFEKFALRIEGDPKAGFPGSGDVVDVIANEGAAMALDHLPAPDRFS